MIYKLKGIVDEIAADSVILDVGGVGYHLLCSTRTLAQLPTVGGACTLHTEMIVREDAHMIFGFIDAEERQWFRLLTTVQGVGNRVALALLSSADVPMLAQAIRAQDKAFIARADGIGPKLAARLVTELKDKVEKMNVSFSATAASYSRDAEGITPLDTTSQDAVAALTRLGYKLYEANAAIRALTQNTDENYTLTELIRRALAHLTKG